MAIKVIVKRKVAKGNEAELLPLLLELRTKATSRPGYISGETLRGVEDPEDCLVIGTWQSVENWKEWESNPEGPRSKIKSMHSWEKKRNTVSIFMDNKLVSIQKRPFSHPP